MALDYLLGYRVRAVSAPLKATDWSWAIIFEDDSRVVCLDAESPKPAKSLENTTFKEATIAEDGATLVFGSGGSIPDQTVQLVNYGVELGGDRPRLEERDVEGDRPDDPSAERVAEGPVEN